MSQGNQFVSCSELGHNQRLLNSTVSLVKKESLYISLLSIVIHCQAESAELFSVHKKDKNMCVSNCERRQYANVAKSKKTQILNSVECSKYIFPISYLFEELYYVQINGSSIDKNDCLRLFEKNYLRDIGDIISKGIDLNDRFEINVDLEINTNNSALPEKNKIEEVWSVDERNDHPSIIKAMRYIHENFRDSFTISFLSKKCFVSASHLSFLFKKKYGVSFKKIILHVRIEKAKKIINSMPARQITQVAHDVGFSDLSHFEKTFKKYVGVSPRVYRAM